MGELDGLTYIVTGANTGIGRATATELARRGGRVHLACRSESRTRPVVDDIVARTGNRDVFFLPLDLGDLASVRGAAKAFLDSGEPLHGLVNNAGVAGQRGLTADGFELAFGTNHLGHFLLTTLLLDRLKESAPARVVNVSSDSHYRAKTIPFDDVRKPTSFTGLPEYSVSKLANVLFTQELARRLEGTGVTSYSLHPGVIASDIWRRVPALVRPLMKVFMKSTEDGAATSVYCATAPVAELPNGGFFDNCKPRQPNKAATPELARELWERSEAWVA